jgi:hypothetical protein
MRQCGRGPLVSLGFLLERMTTEGFTRAMDQAAVEVPEWAAECRRTDFSEWRLGHLNAT